MLKDKILELKKTGDFVILAHNYQIPDIQDIADFRGDSLELCRISQDIDAQYIVFCGVTFMAETAAILNPEKTVLIPDNTSRCPLAAMLPAERIKEAKKKYPEAAVVVYVNTLAEAKAEADITCTSANPVKVVNSLDENTILFGPDKNLAWYTQNHTEKKILPLPKFGHCRVHEFMITKEDVLSLKKEHPDASVLAHPECLPEVQELADYICSTSQMLKRAALDSKEFIIGTEKEMCYRLKKEFPEKEFYSIEKAVCTNMKKHTLPKLYRVMKKKDKVVTVDPDIAQRARRAIERMLELR
jgi:quinolinate synthase